MKTTHIIVYLYFNKKGRKEIMKITITIGGKKFPNRKEKEQECFEQLQHSVQQDPVIEVVTLRKAFDIFIEEKTGVYAKSTIEKYEHLRDKHFERIMDMAVGCIGEEELQASFDDEIAKGWSKKTLQNYRGCIRNVFEMVRPDFNPEIRIDKVDKVG